MPWLTVAHPKGQGGRVDQDRACGWMEDKEEAEPEESTSHQTPVVHQPQETCWSQTLSTLRTLRPWRGLCSVLPVGVMWSVCQLEAPLPASLFLVDVFWRLLLVCFLWTVLGGCVHALQCRLRPGQSQGGTPPRTQPEVVTENRRNHYLWMSPSRGPGHKDSLALALAHSLLLCVLQEPLPDPSVPHIKALLSRLQSVSHTLEKADIRSEAKGRDSALIHNVKLVCSYLQQRMRSLRRLVQVQGDFEAGVKDVLEGLEGLWAQLEQLHTGVTLTKEGSQDHGDLASAQTDAETLFAVLGHYRNILQCCQAHLKDSTQLLQELTWSHTHISNTARSSSESVWPELLLQSNMEQFDKVQESFLSVEQQTSTFQAHLEGLGKENQEGHAGPFALARANSRSESPQTSSGRSSDVEHRNSTSPSDEDVDGPRSLYERSALQFSSTIGRLRKSGRKKLLLSDHM